MALNTKVFTLNITSQFIITADMGVVTASILLLSGGAATVIGDQQGVIGGHRSGLMNLTAGIPLTLTGNTNAPLDDITINVGSGTVQLVLGL